LSDNSEEVIEFMLQHKQVLMDLSEKNPLQSMVRAV